jgi:hypothetical protein
VSLVPFRFKTLEFGLVGTLRRHPLTEDERDE